MVMKYCNSCKADTEHKESLERKPSSYDQQKSIFGRFMLFVHEFINGGHYYNMNRYMCCNVCKNKSLENVGKEFE
ncbi:TPA: hypothetical protein ACGF0S_003611 [Vibrio cholerae]